MINLPRLVLFLAVSNYLSIEQVEKLKYDIAQKGVKGDLNFIKTLKKHFDFELFRSNPFVWQDIWLYNYITYDVKTKFPRVGLIAKYDREIIVPQSKIIERAKEIIGLL